MIGGLLAVIMHPRVATSFNESLRLPWALWGHVNQLRSTHAATCVYTVLLALSHRATDSNRACKSIKPIAHLFKGRNYAGHFLHVAQLNLQMVIANLMSLDLRPHCAGRVISKCHGVHSITYCNALGLTDHTLLCKIDSFFCVAIFGYFNEDANLQISQL